MKKLLLMVVRIVVSGCLALGILTVFCYFYYNVPVHSLSSDGVTDYRWEPCKFYCRATEGIAWGRTNNEGYLNLVDYEQGSIVDILLMGSSHMEAYQVGMMESAAAVLQKKIPEYGVYNIGTSGHSFLTCVKNLNAAVEKYKPRRYVIIETGTTEFNYSDLKDTLEGKRKAHPSFDKGIVGVLQKNQFLRLLWMQLRQGFLDDRKKNRINIQMKNSKNDKDGSSLLNTLLGNVRQTVNCDVKIVIVYHPSTKVLSDGQLFLGGKKEAVGKFSELCKDNGIIFLDMSRRFISDYEILHVLPHGFCNSPVGKGHLNRYGHRMIAQELASVVKEGCQ